MMISFIQRRPAVPNLGDDLCSPRHYFVLQASTPVALIGGGAFSDFGLEEAAKRPRCTKVTWGIGRSLLIGEAPLPIDDEAVRSTYRIASTRDPEWCTDGIDFVPCVSVLHSLAAIAPGTERGLFLNADPNASGKTPESIMRQQAHAHPHLVIGSNAMGEASYCDAFARTREIVTNSYHTAYWAWLSGRAVALLGYSSKFTSLLRALGLPGGAFRAYRRGSESELASLVDAVITDPCFVRLDDYRERRERFRSINRDFAQRLVRTGVFSAAECRC